jgi:hypothetical protein
MQFVKDLSYQNFKPQSASIYRYFQNLANYDYRSPRAWADLAWGLKHELYLRRCFFKMPY